MALGAAWHRCRQNVMVRASPTSESSLPTRHVAAHPRLFSDSVVQRSTIRAAWVAKVVEYSCTTENKQVATYSHVNKGTTSCLFVPLSAVTWETVVYINLFLSERLKLSFISSPTLTTLTNLTTLH